VKINLLKGAVKEKPIVIPVILKVNPPVPKITAVTDRGIIKLIWNMDMIPISNLLNLGKGHPPPLTVTIEPGSVESSIEDLQL
jgi:hypothetical protein